MRKIGENDSAELKVGGRVFQLGDEGEFEVLASALDSERLSEIPAGAAVRLCDRVIGGRELYGRQPDCIFQRSYSDELLARVTTSLIAAAEKPLCTSTMKHMLREQLTAAYEGLWPLIKAGLVASLEESVFEEIAYLTYCIRLPDQPILEAEAYVEAIEGRFGNTLPLPPKLFLCHASEDKVFAKELVAALEERALYAWFDSREILVGDSIAQRINEALEETRFVVAVLSPRSIKKPWVLRELNSSLMRQLGDARIKVLPVLLEKCRLPPLLTDLKYADFTEDFETGFRELLQTIRGG